MSKSVRGLFCTASRCTRARAAPCWPQTPTPIRHPLQGTRLSAGQPRPFSGRGAKSASPSGHLNTRHYISGFLALTGVIGGLLLTSRTLAHAEAPPDRADPQKSKHIRLAEVQKHGADSPSPWVIHGTRVYDITDWVGAHPGGQVILRAAGGSVDPYWDIFKIHQKQDVYDILEQYFVGELDPADLVDGQVPRDKIEDPFVKDPKRDGKLVVHTSKPCNAETPVDHLNTFITPNPLFYVRSHFWVPEIPDPDAHPLHVELLDGTECTYTLRDLKSKFPAVTITAALQCSGNRRNHMNRHSAKPTSGLPWEVGAISNASFTGARLRDVLADAGLDVHAVPSSDPDAEETSAKHVQFTGMEAYGASIPLEKAISATGDVLLVYEMNGAPLPPDHGYPLRLLAPGHVAARSVKWLSKIVVSEDESSSQWQQKDYKLFGPNESGKGPEFSWEGAPAIQEMPVQSAITQVRECDAGGPGEGTVEVEGYAYSGGGRAIVRVDVSADNGNTWTQAEIIPAEYKGSKRWSWTQWRWTVPREAVEKGEVLVCKAVDEGYNTQPERYECQWNFRGNLTSSWHRVRWCDVKSRNEVQRESAS